MSSTNASNEEYRYEKLPWPDHNDRIEAGYQVIIPVACIEDHGRHLPIDVDIANVTAICDKLARSRDDTLLFPTIDNGYDPHHAHFPGTICLSRESFIGYCMDIGLSLTHHGYERVLFVNGHGSNHHLLDQVQRQVNLQRPTALTAMVTWWQLKEVGSVMAEIADGGPYASGHAGEAEASVYSHLHPDAFDRDLAEREIPFEGSKHFYRGWWGDRDPAVSSRVTMMPYWSQITDTGTAGDPTVATPEKGEQIIDAAVAGLGSILDEFATLDVPSPRENHVVERTDRDYDLFRPG